MLQDDNASWRSAGTEAKESCIEPSTGVCQALAVLNHVDDDGRVHWHRHERFHHLFEDKCDALGPKAARGTIAVEYDAECFSFADLEALSNQIARYLEMRGAEAGQRIGLLFDRSVYSYAAVLAVSKMEAVFVPLDAGFPPDRLRYIIEDSDVGMVITMSMFAALFDGLDLPVVLLDAAREDIQKQSQKRAEIRDSQSSDDALCYIIYTSGSTGRPKGVQIRHSSICNFLRVACRHYGYQETDRVYQTLTIAFDYSFEEIWVPLLSGARLVPAPSEVNLLGQDLAEFLTTNKISALCCVPTLLATIEGDLPDLRFLIVSGEACPQDLIARWSKPERRILNLYGPTETTVSATWSVVREDRKVTIGGPLPTYTAMILSPHEPKLMGRGDVGEIGLAGIGLSDGYLNRRQETENAFIEDFVGIANNPSGRIYRTGDMGRINEYDEIEYLGRIDTQVKIRGYRIELEEIEAVARDVTGLSSVVVNPVEVDAGSLELAAYYTCSADNDAPDPAQIQEALRDRLPSYMVPAFYEELDAIPMLPSHKVDRKKLPMPTQARLLSSGKSFVEPQPGCEADLAKLLASVLKIERVSADADFFNDLGANSLSMARFIAGIRKTLGLKRVSMKQVYQNSTILQLASAISPQIESDMAAKPGQPDTVEQMVVAKSRNAPMLPPVLPKVHAVNVSAASRPTEPSVAGINDESVPFQHGPTVQKENRVASDAEYILCGVLQLAYLTAMAFAASYAILIGYQWIDAATSATGVYARAVACATLFFVLTSLLLVAVKWIAVGRFDGKKIPIWSVRYVRFWIAQSAIRANPLNLFAGTPLFNWYLRMLGAKIGRRAVIFARVPICTDLITVGNDTLIRQDCLFPGYTAHAGYLYPGQITIGDRAYVGEATVLEINSTVGNDAQLGTTSVLHENRSIPDGKIYQGSPAIETDTDFIRVPSEGTSTSRALLYAIGQMLTLFFASFPLGIVAAYLLIDYGFPGLGANPGAQVASVGVTQLLWYSASIYLAGIVVGLAFVMTLPRLFNTLFVPDKPHPLFGLQFFLARSITGFSNSIMLHELFGDSSMIVHYFRALGYDLSENTQTGSNFGVEQRHHSPFLCKFSRNTLVSDGLVLLNMDMSRTLFRMSNIAMPPDTYLGNDVHYPVGAQVGKNCLIATKAMVPIDGPVRENVGLLGSPPFEIPRSVARDGRFDHYKHPDILKDRLRLKLRSNLVTLMLFMFRNWSALFLVMMMFWGAHAVFAMAASDSIAAIAAMLAVVSLSSTVLLAYYFILFERCATLFKPLKPLYCSLYDRDFWDHERFWKLNLNTLITAFDGTPIKTLMVRAQGVKLGKKVFDNGAGISEPTMVEIGDYSCLNHRCTIQGHSLEDGTFKSDAIRIGARCTIGVQGFVHYGSSMDDDAIVEADAFVMKGSVIAKGETWVGNPARHVHIQENEQNSSNQIAARHKDQRANGEPTPAAA